MQVPDLTLVQLLQNESLWLLHSLLLFHSAAKFYLAKSFVIAFMCNSTKKFQNLVYNKNVLTAMLNFVITAPSEVKWPTYLQF